MQCFDCWSNGTLSFMVFGWESYNNQYWWPSYLVIVCTVYNFLCKHCQQIWGHWEEAQYKAKFIVVSVGANWSNVLNVVILHSHYGTAPVDPCRPQNRGSHDYLRAHKGSWRMSPPLIQDSSVRVLTTPENTITYHNGLCLSPQNFA